MVTNIRERKKKKKALKSINGLAILALGTRIVFPAPVLLWRQGEEGIKREVPIL